METPTLPANAAVDLAAPAPQKLSPAAWRQKKRLVEPHPDHAAKELHEDRQKRLLWDAFFAGARVLSKWEDEFPLITEAEFDAALQAVKDIELGGHHPNGTHPRAPKATR